MSKEHWCPIEGRECGNVDGPFCMASEWSLSWDTRKEFERCPFPSKIKEVLPDPGPGWELVQYDPDTVIGDDWESWRYRVQRWAPTMCSGRTMASASDCGRLHYRRPKYAICPIEGEQCKHAAGGPWCSVTNGAAGIGSWNGVKIERCPWPSKKGM